ncbi:MAG: hypothetical protein V2J55_03250 [Candidatus Competibacteraceae bacterium]|jgi:hypothetical protein|nr:hypothetical protein [Candidatus Competibacteraceae bacterium]
MRQTDEGFLESLKRDYESVNTPPFITQRTLTAIESQQTRHPWFRPALAAMLLCSLVAGVWMGTGMLQTSTPALQLAIPNLGSSPSLTITKPAVGIQNLTGFSAFPLLPPSPQAPQKPGAHPRERAGHAFPISSKPRHV